MWIEKYVLKDDSREIGLNKNENVQNIEQDSTQNIQQIMKSSNFISSSSEFIQMNAYDNFRFNTISDMTLGNSSEQSVQNNQIHPAIQQMDSIGHGFGKSNSSSNFCRIESSELFGPQPMSQAMFNSGIVESKNFVDFIKSKSIINAFNNSLFDGKDSPDILTMSSMMPRLDETEIDTLKRAVLRKNLR